MAKDDVDKVPDLVGKLAGACDGQMYTTVILAAVTLAEYCADKLLENPETCKGEPRELVDMALVLSAKLQQARASQHAPSKLQNPQRFIFRWERS